MEEALQREARALPKEMDIVVPTASASPEFRFSSCNTAPSSPKPFGNPEEYFYCYTSAPTSPTRATAAYSYLVNEFESRLDLDGQKELNRAVDRNSIRYLSKPSPLLSPKSPRERERNLMPPMGREIRSLSPSRGDRGLRFSKAPVTSPSTSTSAPATTKSGSKKWRLKDLLFFRSASEGRATGRGSKDTLRKYTMLSSSFVKRKQEKESKSAMGRPTSLDDSHGSFKRVSSGAAVSTHELHYTASRAATEELKKKTPLPFNRNGLFGCLHFNPAVRSIARGFNGYSFNQSR